MDNQQKSPFDACKPQRKPGFLTLSEQYRELVRIQTERANQERFVEEKKPVFGEWQLCPKCNGEGTGIKTTTLGLGNYKSVIVPCVVCDGKKILSRPVIK